MVDYDKLDDDGNYPGLPTVTMASDGSKGSATESLSAQDIAASWREAYEAMGLDPDDVPDPSAYSDLAQTTDLSDHGIDAVDDALFDAYEKSVWWALEADQETLTLQKAPDIWESLGELGAFIRDAIREVIRRPDVVWSDYSTAESQDATQAVRHVLEQEMTQPSGWTLGGVADGLRRELDLSQSEALDIARNETASVLNVARAEAVEDYAREVDQDPEEYLFDWVGPTDHRTTPICRETEAEIEARGGAVTLQELKGILMAKAKEHADDGGTPERVDEFHPHFNCRRTFVRRVQSI